MVEPSFSLMAPATWLRSDFGTFGAKAVAA